MRWLNKNKHICGVVLMLLSSGTTTLAVADALPERIALPEFLQLVQQRNPDLQADRMQIDAAQADLQTASAIPNPVVGYTRKPGEKEMAIEQPIPIFGQRGKRMEGAQLGIEAASTRVDAARADRLRDAARDFITLLIAQEKYAQRQKAETQMDAARRIVNGQVEAGARSRYDKTRIDLERANAQMQVAQAQAALSDARARVAAAIAVPQWRPVAVGVMQPSSQAPAFSTLWEDAQNRIPAVRAAIAEQARADKMIEVEQREAWPTPSIGVGKLRDSEGRHSVLGVSVEIPLFNRRQGEIAKAQAQAREAMLRREAVIRNAQNELQRATDLLAQRLMLTNRFRDEGLAMLPALNQMAQDAYTYGQGTVLELLDSIQSVAEKQMTYLDLMESVLQAELDVRFAAGDIPSGLAVKP
ncbi:TolC family protein [uncultured Oxalicibacterium sp.]|uniref:TolC family protein n=1 Tax=uncultured Oxalicibacterium sp. TaxID=1168540 RepID=UPI0025DA2AF0|nr:TolC family protein [uncultured Oxalicibacterium sp.]